MSFKGTVQPKSKTYIFPWPLLLFIHVAFSFGLSCFEVISHRDVCLLTNIMKLDGTSPTLHQKINEKNSKPVSLSKKIMARLLKIIHRPCREQFHGGTTFFRKEVVWVDSETV